MKRHTVALCLLVCALAGVAALTAAAAPPGAAVATQATKATTGKRTWNFDSVSGFTFDLTGQGTKGTWEIKADPTAPSKPNVLAQTSTDRTGYRFPLAIVEDTSYRDLDLSVKFKAVSGEVDQAGGLIFRAQDAKNYYVVRANALEGNYRLYHVTNGRRQQIAGANFKVTPNEWHTLRVEAEGETIRCYYDGELKITQQDKTFLNAGKIGLWTKADSVTYFDDLEAQPRGH